MGYPLRNASFHELVQQLAINLYVQGSGARERRGSYLICRKQAGLDQIVEDLLSNKLSNKWHKYQHETTRTNK